MKKRILGLALALCLIVGLLPMAVGAEGTQPAGTLKMFSVAVGNGDGDAQQANGSTTWDSNLDQIHYGKTAADGQSITWDGTEADYNIKVEQTANGLEITLNNAKLIRTANHLYGMIIRYEGKVTIHLIGENEIGHAVTTKKTTVPAAIYVKATEGATITGTGSLKAYGDGHTETSSPVDVNGDGTKDKTYDFGSIIEADCDLTIKDVTMDLDQVCTTSTQPWAGHGIRCSGNLTIDNANLDIYAQYGSGIRIGAGRNTWGTNRKNLTITNGAKVTIEAGYYAIAVSNNDYIYMDSTTGDTQATIKSATGYSAFRLRPELSGNFEAYYSTDPSGATGVTDYDGQNGDRTVTYNKYHYFQYNHICHTDADDHDCTTVENCVDCKQPIGTAQTAHTPKTDDGDCTTAVLCANPGCEKVATAAAAAHTPEADDGDCTTAIKCSVCGTETTPGASAHTPPANRTDCSVAANCTVCGKEALAAGQHTGGTATCKDKAVCTVCNQAYGELSTTHTPAADDNNCATAVKCTVCQAEVVAAKQHAYTDNTDKTCNNAGCTYTRALTPNPNTGDVSILLTAAIALSSAVGFAGVTVLRKKKD